MEISNLALAYLVAELKQIIEGTFLNSVQLVQESVFRIKLHSKEHGTLDLIATPGALYKTSYKVQVQQAQSGFAAFLKKQLYNKRVLLLEQHCADRIIELHFSDCDLVLELFAKGNVIFKDKSGKIVSCYRNEDWKDRKIRRGEQYKYPASKPGILETSESNFKKILKESPQDCVRAIVSALNVAPLAAEEACAKAGIEKTKKSAELSENSASALFAALAGLYSVDLKNAKPVVAVAGKEKQLLPFAFRAVAAESANFASFSEAIDENITRDFAQEEAEKARAETSKKKARLEYSEKEQLKAKERLEKDVVESRRKAELIFEHYEEIKELSDAVKKAMGKKISKKDIMYKIKSAGETGSKPARILADIDPKTKKLVLELPDK